MKIASRWVAVAVLFGCAGIAQAGPDWVEGGRFTTPDDEGFGPDAGSFLQTAQITTGSGQLNTLEGRLGGGSAALYGDRTRDLEDMYIITVSEPGNFSVAVDDSVTFSVALYLFRIVNGQAVGMLGSQTGFLSSLSTDDSEIEVTEPGLYALAVTFAGNVPKSGTEPIFEFDLGLGAAQGATSSVGGTIGASNSGPHDGWSGGDPGALGNYLLTFTGASLVPGVGPLSGALAMLGMGAIATGRRRRA